MTIMRRTPLAALVLFGLSGMAPAPAAETAVTLAQVTAAPADIQLSYRFALQQVRAGRLDQAAVALRQVLQTAPQWDAARLFYGTVLFRLNDLQGARNELAAVARRPISQAQQEEVARYLALIESRSGEVRETAFLPPSPAQAGIASLLMLGGSQSASRKGEQQARIDGAFASAEIADEDKAVGGGHGSFLFLGEAGDPSGAGPGSDPGLYAAAGFDDEPVLSSGKARITADVLRAAFGPGLPEVLSSAPAITQPTESSKADAERFLATTPGGSDAGSDSDIAATDGTPMDGAAFPKPVARPAAVPATFLSRKTSGL